MLTIHMHALSYSHLTMLVHKYIAMCICTYFEQQLIVLVDSPTVQYVT